MPIKDIFTIAHESLRFARGMLEFCLPIIWHYRLGYLFGYCLVLRYVEDSRIIKIISWRVLIVDINFGKYLKCLDVSHS